MRVLVIKTSSLGDVLHTLPALTDAARHAPGVRFDWLVEPAYETVCRWHPAVDRTISVGYRNWRRAPLRIASGGARALSADLRARSYDRVIDAQGLIKSALFSAIARGPRHGFHFESVSEWPAALVYRHRHVVTSLGAVDRLRDLFAAALAYARPTTPADFGLRREQFGAAALPGRYVVYAHGTAWPTKHWPVARWRDLARLAAAQGYGVCLPWSDDVDKARAAAIADGTGATPVRLDIEGVAGALANSVGAVGGETAFSHLAAALGLPTVTLYGPTGTARHGTNGPSAVAATPVDFPCSPCYGRSQCHRDPAASASPPCLASITAETVWRNLMAASERSARGGE